MFGYPKRIYAGFILFTVVLGVVLALWWPPGLWVWVCLPVLVVVGALDLRSRHNVLCCFSPSLVGPEDQHEQGSYALLDDDGSVLQR